MGKKSKHYPASSRPFALLKREVAFILVACLITPSPASSVPSHESPFLAVFLTRDAGHETRDCFLSQALADRAYYSGMVLKEVDPSVLNVTHHVPQDVQRQPFAQPWPTTGRPSNPLSERPWQQAEALVQFLAIREELPEHADGMLVLGSSDERVPHEAKRIFWRERQQPRVHYVVASGGRGRGTPDDWDTEADTYLRIMSGVGPSYREPDSTQTGENGRNSKALMKEQGLPHETLLLLQTPMLQLRATLEARRTFGPGTRIIAYAPYIPNLRDVDDVARLHYLRDGVTEIAKLLVFQKADPEHPGSPYIDPFEIPNAILEGAVEIADALINDPAVTETTAEQLGRRRAVIRAEIERRSDDPGGLHTPGMAPVEAPHAVLDAA